MPYLAAVHEIMGEKNPAQAARFATQMQKAGLAAEAEKNRMQDSSPSPVPIPPAPTPAPPTPVPEPDRKPGTTEGTEATSSGLGGRRWHFRRSNGHADSPERGRHSWRREKRKGYLTGLRHIAGCNRRCSGKGIATNYGND